MPETHEALLVLIEELRKQDAHIKALDANMRIMAGVLNNLISGKSSSTCQFCGRFPCSCLELLDDVNIHGIDFSEQSE